MTLYAAGSFGGGTLTLQAGYTNLLGTLTWITIAGISLTASGMASFDHRLDNLRVVLAGATTPDIHVQVQY